jgi:hypothetical protein
MTARITTMLRNNGRRCRGRIGDRPGLPRMHAELQPASQHTAIAALPAACRSGQPDEPPFHIPAARR